MTNNERKEIEGVVDKLLREQEEPVSVPDKFLRKRNQLKYDNDIWKLSDEDIFRYATAEEFAATFERTLKRDRKVGGYVLVTEYGAGYGTARFTGGGRILARYDSLADARDILSKKWRSHQKSVGLWTP